MTQLFYAGIGSRETPPAIQQIMRIIAAELGSRGWVLRSGHAEGADIAFEYGAFGRPKEIYLPWKGFNGGQVGKDGAIIPESLGNYKQAMTYAEHFHPAWEKCSNGAKALHTRNIYQILGQDLNTPVKCVVCWTKDGKSSGGTGQALRLAEYLEIPIFNLHDPSQRDKLADYVLATELEHAK
jgi:hypothetical protein